MKEPVLAPILRFMRLRIVIPVVRKMYHPKLLDIGCGWDAKFLENVEPYIHEKEVNRVLIGGLLILTVPSRLSKPVLEFLTKLGIVNPIEIRDHKKYYDKKDILGLFVQYGFEIQKHQYF